MKKVIVSAICLAIVSIAQTFGQTPVYPVIFDENIPAEASRNLENKVEHILSAYGYGSVSTPERMVMSVTIDVVENNVTPTNPPRVSKKIDVTMKVGDAIENKVFGSAVVSLSGIGLNDTKAYIAAFNNLKAENKTVKKLFSTVDTELEDYYATSGQVILDKARAMAMKGNIDEAIAYLVSVPPVNMDCYNACQDLAITYYAEKVNQASQNAYSNALAAWTANKTQAGAKEALRYLKNVDSASASYPQALQLWDEISGKLDQDEIEAKEQAKKEYEDKVAFRNSIVDAVKSIGVAFGEHQPQSVTKLVRRW